MIEDLASCCWDYKTAKELLEVIEAGEATLYIHSEGKGYTDIGILFQENNYLDRIRDDLRVYMIELRGIIRKVLREDELKTTGAVTEEAEEDDDPDFEVPERRQGIPKQDYRRDHE